LVVSAPQSSLAATPKKPNIVIILVDDMGWHNLHAPPVHVNAEIESPAIAKLAEEGVTLTNYYAYRYCGPSRASLLTGRLPGHGISEGMFSPAQPYGYNANLTMLPAKLKTAGYKAIAIGKWHCGFHNVSYLPTSRGFDAYTGYLSGSEDHFTQQTADTCGTSKQRTVGTDLWTDDGTGPHLGGRNAYGVNGSYSAYTYTQLAVDAVTKYGRRAVDAVVDDAGGGGGSRGASESVSQPLSSPSPPLFLYLALQNIHGPDQVATRFLSKYNATTIYPARRTLDAMVSAADETVANVTAAIEAAGMTQNTVVLLLSDNGGPIQEPSGGWSPGNNWPLRGGKYSFYEGGIKVVGMIKYPALLSSRAGTAWDGLVHASDWYATLCTLAGVLPNDTGEGRVPIDGVDIMPALVAATASPRTELLLGNHNGTDGSYRCNTPGNLPDWPAGTPTTGGMKLIVGTQRVGSAWVGPRYPNGTTPGTVWPEPADCERGCLYNLTADPTESTDLASVQPAHHYAMMQRFLQLSRVLTAPNGDDEAIAQKITDPRACERVASSGGWWGPWN